MRSVKCFVIMGSVAGFSVAGSTAAEGASPLCIPTQLTHSLNYATAPAPDDLAGSTLRDRKT
jgi:hypothetical protein